MPSRRVTCRLTALALVLALACAPLLGCGRKAAKDSTGVQKSGGATSNAATATGSSKKPKPSVYEGPAIIAPASTLQPPDYDGFQPLPCFTYHTVDPKLKNSIAITPAKFESQLKILRDLGFHTITARQLYAHHAKGTPLPDKPVMITFDDGWRNQYVYAAPLLKKYDMVATFFINPQPITHDYPGYLSKDMVKKLAKAGHGIESHTWRHRKVTRDRSDSADSFQRKNVGQLVEASNWIRKVVGTQPVALCYPFGFYDLEAIGMAQRAGYKLGFTVDEGIADARPWDAYQIKRFTISNVETTESFKRRLLSGALQVRNIKPAPASRVVGTNATVSVDITDVPAEISDVKLSAGAALRKMRIVERNGRRYAEATFHKAKRGVRPVTMRGTGTDGRKYYASWILVLGDKKAK